MAAAIALSVVTACSQVSRPAIDTTWTRDGTTLHLAGTTDLPDGALVDYEIWSGEDGGESLDVTGTAQVHGGHFAADVKLVGPLPQQTRSRIRFEPGGDQPAAVTSIYGDDGSGLDGPSVVEDYDGRRFETVAPVVVGS